jgi:hypothetical protein
MEEMLGKKESERETKMMMKMKVDCRKQGRVVE